MIENVENVNWELIIGIFSLLASIGHIVYSFFASRIKIDIVDLYKDSDVADPKVVRIEFSIFNNSEKSILVTDISICKDGQLVKDNGYEPSNSEVIVKSVSNSSAYSNPFESKFYINPRESQCFTYYVYKDTLPNAVKVTLDKRFNWFTKHKTFDLHFD